MQRRALGLLFLLLTLAFALIAIASIRAGQWIIGAAAVAVGGWLATLAGKGLGRR